MSSNEANEVHGHEVPLHKRAKELSPVKRNVLHILESQVVEIVLLCLILADVVLVTIEAGIDHRLICVDGHVVHESPQSIRGGTPHHFLLPEPVDVLAAAAPQLFLGVSSSHAAVAPLRRTHRVAGAAMLEAGRWQEPAGREVPARIITHGKPAAAGGAAGEGHEHHEARGAEHGAEHGHGGGAHHHEEVAKALVCDHPSGHHAGHLAHTCHMMSVSILLIFLAELLLKLWIAPREFLESRFEVLDMFVVVSSLIVDLYIHHLIESQKEDEGSSGAADALYLLILLMILRVWRVLRIVHGIYAMESTIHEREEAEIEEQKQEIRRLSGIVERSDLAKEL